MIEQKDKVSKEFSKEGSTRAELRVVSDRVSESFSTVLKKTREKKGLSLRQAADAMYVPSATLLALEERRYDKLPADIYTIGYIRTYAALLELNPEGLIKDFKQSKELLELNARDRLLREQQAQRDTVTKQEPVFEQWVHSFRDNFVDLNKKFVKRLLMLVALVLLVSFLFVQLRVDEGDAQVESFNYIDKVKVLSADGSVHISALTPDKSAALVTQSNPVEENQLTEAITESKIKMMLSDTSWITIRDAQQNLIHQSRQQKGEVLEVAGQAPFSVRLSKASAVNLYVNGQHIDFSKHVTIDDQLHEFIVAP